MNQAILNAIRAKATNQVTKVSKPIPQVTKPQLVNTPRITLRIEDITNKNRLDLFFSAIPEQAIRDKMKAANFWYRPSDHAWFNQRNPETIRFIIEKLLPHFDHDPYPVTERAEKQTQNDAPLNDLDTGNTSACTTDQQVRFTRYCEQIDRLKAELNLDLQEILFNAIDLYFQSEILN